MSLDTSANGLPQERNSLLLLGNLPHDEFLSLLTRCFAYVRTPACDGISASILESLALGIPVIASENGRRPPGVITYPENDADKLYDQLRYVTEHYAEVKKGAKFENLTNNTKQTADWILEYPGACSRRARTSLGVTMANRQPGSVSRRSAEMNCGPAVSKQFANVGMSWLPSGREAPAGRLVPLRLLNRNSSSLTKRMSRTWFPRCKDYFRRHAKARFAKPNRFAAANLSCWGTSACPTELSRIGTGRS